MQTADPVRSVASCLRRGCGWIESSTTTAGAIVLADEHRRRTRHPVTTDVPPPPAPMVPVGWAVVDSHDKVQGVHLKRSSATAVAGLVDGWSIRPLVMVGLDEVAAEDPDGAS